ncbi:MAG: hypothetical protein QXT45_00975 [Candidatus Bilamarchaeaceae archaeon]
MKSHAMLLKLAEAISFGFLDEKDRHKTGQRYTRKVLWQILIDEAFAEAFIRQRTEKESKGISSDIKGMRTEEATFFVNHKQGKKKNTSLRYFII